jgi:hypothetical protein
LAPTPQVGAALRLFVMTRDPLGWLPERGSAWATAKADGDVLKVPVCVTHGENQAASLHHALAVKLSIIFAGAYPEPEGPEPFLRAFGVRRVASPSALRRARR